MSPKVVFKVFLYFVNLALCGFSSSANLIKHSEADIDDHLQINNDHEDQNVLEQENVDENEQEVNIQTFDHTHHSLVESLVNVPG